MFDYEYSGYIYKFAVVWMEIINDTVEQSNIGEMMNEMLMIKVYWSRFDITFWWNRHTQLVENAV